MMKFIEELKKVLKLDERFIGENNQIVRTKVADAARGIDGLLMKSLLQNDLLRESFFSKVDDIYVFDKMKFIWVIESKEFLPDSYTLYKNKIGLVDNHNNFISEQQDVTLAWPYKDCVLEGAQTKENQKSEEVFYNEVLAPDQVNRLLAPKVLGKAKRYTANGVEKNIIFNDNDNLIIKGNNLLGLSTLLERFAGQVQLIYIDPPYNTGNDSFKYNDRFNHSSWLTFMKNRLELAYKLLKDNGSMYVQIDNNESAYLKVLMDEIFGKEHFQTEIIWVLEGASGYKSLVNNYVRGHDSILFYTKSDKFKYHKTYLPYDEKQLKRFSSVDEDGRRYKAITKTRKLYLDEAKGIPLTDVWNDIASFQTIVNSPERTGFDTQKPEKLLERIISCSSDEGDLILDFHLGSGTTSSVAHKMKRQYIGIEQMDYIENITVERMKKVVCGVQNGISKNYNGQGGSFVYCELLEDNQSLINEIKGTSDLETIKSILTIAIDRGKIVPSVLPIDLEKTESEFDKLSLEEQKKLALDILNKNKLYISLSDIDDEDANVSEADKAFTKSFYGLE